MQLKHRMMTAAAAAGTAVLMGTAVYAAGSGYTPTTNPAPTGTPGGYSQVVTAETISPNATTTTTKTVKVDNIPVTVAVPPGTFSSSVQVVVTAPVLSQVTSGVQSLGFSGYTAIAGLGISVVKSSGQLYKGSFLKPISVTVSNSNIASGDRVVQWNAAGAFSQVASASIHQGKASWTFQQDPAFAVLAPKNSGVVPGATTPVTGKPFLSEGLIGLAFIAGGSALLFRTRRRRLS